MATTAIQISISGELLEKYKVYADLANQPLTKVAKAALSEWMQDYGEADIEALTGIPASDIPLDDEKAASTPIVMALVN